MTRSPHHVFSWIALPCAGLTAILTLGGCSTPPQRTVSDASAAAQITAPVVPEVARTVEPTRPTYAGPWEDPSNPLYRRTIYFDYDAVDIKPEFIPLMRTHATYLGTNAGRRVTLEGHTDEHGTREYNLSLGDQRADAVRRFLLAEGVPPDRMSTLSYGEERPADPGHGEPSWRANRRVIIQY
ncbi:peptidoglycan-associated lipoprotein [Thiocystis minor]|uniref:peptidoglycan-associated lipoprotein n=1 Tax=Thiocystis minor TaxID=61597 RepID=UPI0019128252|nr:OmpA family protein [Thiocystis minor]MBK5965644.1 peptidoglycan-associated lipoprotein [Thiocystis minor]